MKLISKPLTITEEYKGKTKFSFWKDLKVGDRITVDMDLKPTGSNRGKIYAPTLTATNLKTCETFSDSINSLQNYLSKLKFE